MDIKSLFREKTTDQYIFSKMLGNEYNLKYEDFYGKVVFDVGAHIGGFSYFCLLNGAERVHAFEPNKENFSILEKTTSAFSDKSRIILNNFGIWGNTDLRSLKESGFFDNPGGNNLFFNKSNYDEVPDEKEVDILPLDVYIDDHNETPDLLKLDCEFSEFPIILGSKKIFNIPLIVGEFHEIVSNSINLPSKIPSHALLPEKNKNTAYDANTLKNTFLENGYSFQFRKTHHNLGIFRAEKL